MPDELLVVGAADTGRAPMTAAMLRRRLAERGRQDGIGSAGILGHDDDPPSAEALAAVEQMGLDISQHRARSLTAELAAGAALLVAMDSGVLKVAAARFPEAAARLYTLGDLAGRARDLPDPFKMQIGAWLAYAREIDQLITVAMPRILGLLGDAPAPLPHTQLSARAQAAGRIAQLARVAAQMPGVLDWPAARAQIEGDLARIAALPAAPGDLAPAYVGLLRAALALTATPPTAGQLAALADATDRLEAPVGPGELAAFSARLGGWGGL